MRPGARASVLPVTGHGLDFAVPAA